MSMTIRVFYLHKVWREAVCEEVQQGVNGSALPLLLVLDEGVSVGGAGLDDHCQDDAQADRQEGGGHVVEHRPAADLPAEPQVQGADGGDEAGHDEGDDQTLQHVQEDLARVANVVSLSGSVDSITNRFK